MGTSLPATLLNRPIQLDVGLLKEVVANGRTTMVPIMNGEVLRDDHGVDRSGDDFKVTFEAASECYVYVLAIDGTGWAKPIFPVDYGHENPVTPNRQYQIPDGNNWFRLDEYRGVEAFYFVASNAPRTDLEEHFANLNGMERQNLPAEEAELITEEFVWERGSADAVKVKVCWSRVPMVGATPSTRRRSCRLMVRAT